MKLSPVVRRQAYFEGLPLERLLSKVALELYTLPVRPMEAALRRGASIIPEVEAMLEDSLELEDSNPLWPAILLGELAREPDGASEAAEILGRILAQVASDDRWLAQVAAEGLAKAGDAAIPVIRARLPEANESHRLYLYAALGWLGSDAAAALLLEAMETDRSMADVLALSLHAGRRKEAVEPLYRLIHVCPERHRAEILGVIQDLHHGRWDPSPLDENWRLRYRPRGAWNVFDPGWVGVVRILREELGGGASLRPVPPIRPLEEILAEPPKSLLPPDLETCALCREPGELQAGVRACGGEHVEALAAVQLQLLELWGEEQVDDLFDVLGQAEADLITLRTVLVAELGDPDDAVDGDEGLADDEEGWLDDEEDEEDHPLDAWEGDAAVVMDTCRWFLEQGVHETEHALADLRKRAGRFYRDPAAPPVEEVPPPPAAEAHSPSEGGDTAAAIPPGLLERLGLEPDPTGTGESDASRWLDTPAPALEGLTPRQAAQLFMGRGRLMAILKEVRPLGGGRLGPIENLLAFEWLHRQLSGESAPAPSGPEVDGNPFQTGSEGMDDRHLRVLLDPDEDLDDRLAAAELAGSLPFAADTSAIALLSVLTDPEAPGALRATAAIALGPALDLASSEIADDFPLDPDEPTLSPPVLRQVREILYRVYRDPEAPKVLRRCALEASIRFPEEWHEGAVRAAYHSGDADWKLTAVFSMGWVRGLQDEVMATLAEGDPSLVPHALRAAGNWEVDAAWPYILAVLEDEDADGEALLAAIEAAPFLQPEQARELLSELAHDPDPDIALAAQEALFHARIELGENPWDEPPDG